MAKKKIPEAYQGDRSIVVAEFDGTWIVMERRTNAVIQTDNGPVHTSELPVLAAIDGISEEAEEKIAEIVCAWHRDSGVPVMPITEDNLLKALVSDRN